MFDQLVSQIRLSKCNPIFLRFVCIMDFSPWSPQISTEDRYRPFPLADSRQPLPFSWHSSRCTLRRLHGNHLHIYRPWRGAFRKGQPNSIIELRHATTIKSGVSAKWSSWKNKEGIQAMKTACELPSVYTARKVKQQSLLSFTVIRASGTEIFSWDKIFMERKRSYRIIINFQFSCSTLIRFAEIQLKSRIYSIKVAGDV